MLAGVFMIEHRPLNAAIAIKKAETLARSTNTRLQLVLAYIALNHGDWARPELRDWSRQIRRIPDTTTGWAAGLRRGPIRIGRDRFHKVVDAEPDSVRAYDNLGLCYEALNQPDDAVCPRKAVELNRTVQPQSAWPPLNLGILLRNRGDLKEAEALLREAAKYEDHLAQPWYQLGVLLEQVDHPDDAIVELKRAAEQYSVRGTLLRAGADIPEAESEGRSRRGAGNLPAPARREASHPKPMNPATIVFAIAAIIAQAPDGAQKPAAADGAPASLAPTAVLTDIAGRLDRQDWAGARTVVDGALRTYPNDAALHNFAGVIEAEGHDGDSAETHFKTAIRLAPQEEPSVRESRSALPGARWARIPRREPGRSTSTVALLAFDPTNVEGLYQCGFQLAMSGQFAESRALVEQLPAELRQRPQTLALDELDRSNR